MDKRHLLVVSDLQLGASHRRGDFLVLKYLEQDLSFQARVKTLALELEFEVASTQYPRELAWIHGGQKMGSSAFL